MKAAKTLAIVACAGLLSAGGLGFTHHAYAQDADQIDQNAGAWGAASASPADTAAAPDSKAPPIDVNGCWDGDVEDKADGLGGSFFSFTQDGNKIVGNGASETDLEWPDNSFAFGPIQGKVSSKGITFKGNAGKGCPFSGKGKGDSTELSGKIKFGGECAKFFKHVIFSISPGPC